MRIYDVYYGQELQTSVCVHDDGRKTWEDSAEWQSFHCSEDDKTVIADTIERYPNAEALANALAGFLADHTARPADHDTLEISADLVSADVVADVVSEDSARGWNSDTASVALVEVDVEAATAIQPVSAPTTRSRRGTAPGRSSVRTSPSRRWRT